MRKPLKVVLLTGYDGGSRSISGETTFYEQNPSSRATAAPTRLSSVESPAVGPMETGPSRGSPPDADTSDLVPIGRCRISSAETRQSGSAMWKVGRDAAQILARFAVLLLLSPPRGGTRPTG